MKPKLTIIIPCYNCELTLREAVESCFRQGFSEANYPFEIVAVDDKSTDGTKKLLQQLKNEHAEIKVFAHDNNQGGGATRNTAVAQAQGSIIFCLDGDDILPDNTLIKMAAYLETSKSDGIIFEETHFFVGNNLNKYEIVRNTINNRPITFADLFREDCGFLTKVNFMYTKKAFFEAGGYPTHHGFDTQTFGVRFLAKNLQVRVCPNTAYLHRRNNGPSYFVREYKNGKLSFNSYLILEENFYLFSDKIKKTILDYEIFRDNELGGDNIEHKLQLMINKIGETGFFIPHYTTYLNKDGEERYNNEIARSTKPLDKFTRALWNYNHKNYIEASEFYLQLMQDFPHSKICMMNFLRCYMSDEKVYQLLRPAPQNLFTVIIIKIFRKCRRLFIE